MLYTQPIYEMQSIKWPAASASLNSNITRLQPTMRSAAASTALQSSAALSSNLSELDNLLQELSSAQFAVEVDRRSTGSFDFCCITCIKQILTVSCFYPPMTWLYGTVFGLSDYSENSPKSSGCISIKLGLLVDSVIFRLNPVPRKRSMKEQYFNLVL